MIILTIRTDNPDAEIGIFDGHAPLTHYTWHAHRELAETIHSTMRQQLQKIEKEITNLEGIVLYQGPGSFTGLRIGASVANALADSLHIPIVGVTGKEWEANGVQQLLDGENVGSVMPEYGAEPNITQPRK